MAQPDGPCLKAGDADFFAAFLADAVSPVFQALDGGLDFTNQSTFPVTDAECEGPVGFCGRAIGRIGKKLVAVGQILKG